MRKTAMTALFAMVLGGGVAVMPGSVSAGQATLGPPAFQNAVQEVQYYGGHPSYRSDWERRHDWRERRHARDEARIAEAARREARRIEQERAERRAWRQARRQQYGYYRGY